MNIHSNASGTYVETVALLAALDSCVSTKRRLRILDAVLYLIMNTHMSSLKRTYELRRLLNSIQQFVEFIGKHECVPLDPDVSLASKATTNISSSSSTKKTAKQLKNEIFSRDLDYYVAEILNLESDS